MLRATIVKEKKGEDENREFYHVRVGEVPQIGGNVEVVEVLVQKEGETREQLNVRAYKFLLDEFGIKIPPA